MNYSLKNRSSQRIFNAFVVLLMSVPLMAILTQNILEIETPFIFIVYVLTILLGVMFILVKKSKIPNFLWLLLPYFLYKYFVDFNYNEACEGSLYLTLRENLFIIAIFFGLLIILNSNLNYKFLRILNIYVISVIILAPVVTIIQIYNTHFLSITEVEDSISLYSTRRYSFFGFEDPNAIGFTYVPLVLTFISVFLLKKKKYLSFYLMCIGIVLILSNSRYLMFGIILVFIELIISNKNWIKKSFRYLLIFLIFLVLFFYFLGYIGYNLNSFYNIRLDDKSNNLARLVSFNTFFEVFPKYPLLGIGNEKAPIIINNLQGLSPVIHIGYLNHLVTYGILGSSFLFGFWIQLFKRLYKRAKKTKYWAGAMSMIFFFWANFSLYMYSIFFSGFLICLILENYYALKIIRMKNKVTSN